MEWEPEAKAAIDRAPFFVRRFARRKVEELAQAEGRRLVTLADVRRARDVAGPSGDGPNPLSPFPAREGGTEVLSTDSGSRTPGSATNPHPNPLPEGEGAGPHSSSLTLDIEADIGAQSSPLPLREGGKGVRSALESSSSLSEEQIRLIERLVGEIPGQESRYWSAKSCGGAVGCPLTLVDARAAGDAVVAAIEASGFAEAQATRLKGPVLSHHRLKVAIAGCPNCCSEPQIKDFALVARARPTLGPGDCARCGACEAECKEGAVSTESGAPTFDLSRCVGCGACAETCEQEAILRVVGYDVVVGGRLGRRPRLAARVVEGVTLGEGIALLERCLALLAEEGLPGERLGALLDRVGWDRIDAAAPDDAGPALGVIP